MLLHLLVTIQCLRICRWVWTSILIRVILLRANIQIVDTYPPLCSDLLSLGSLSEFFLLLWFQCRSRQIIQWCNSFLFPHMPVTIHEMNSGYLRPNFVSNPGFVHVRIPGIHLYCCRLPFDINWAFHQLFGWFWFWLKSQVFAWHLWLWSPFHV